MMYCLTEEEYRALKNPIEIRSKIQKEFDQKCLAMVDAIGKAVERHSWSWNPQFRKEFLAACTTNLTPPVSTDAPVSAS